MTGRSGNPERSVKRARWIRPFEEFMDVQVGGGLVLLFTTVLALAWANSPWQHLYHDLWHTPLSVGLGDLVLAQSLHTWINDGLMAVFFFVVGLEIKREMLVGELASPRRAALPLVAALGGMVVPALLYIAFNAGTPAVRGWGIPMATDIAFALGVLGLLGKRVPLALKVFLATLAIADDLGAVLVIAIVYTAELSAPHIAAAIGCLLALAAVNRLGVRNPAVYLLFGIGLWLAILGSGIHATVAGVLAALTIPSRSRMDTDRFLAENQAQLAEFERAGRSAETQFITEHHQAALHAMGRAAIAVQTPMERLEHRLHPWMAFGVMPLFALANAGVVFDANAVAGLTHPVTLGVAVGLLIGKPAGVLGAVWLAIRMRWVALPPTITWQHLYGAGWLAGIGFTMSLFIAELALGGTPQLADAKLGILGASLIAGIVGWWILRRAASTDHAR